MQYANAIMQILTMNAIWALVPISLFYIIIYWVFRKKRNQKLNRKYILISFFLDWSIYTLVIFIIFSGNPMNIPSMFHFLFPVFLSSIILYLVFNKQDSTINLFNNLKNN